MAGKKTTAKPNRKSGNGKVVQKAASKVTTKKIPTLQDPMNKSTIINTIMDLCTSSKKEVVAFLNGLHQIIEHHLKSRGPGSFTLPGLLKINVVKRPARAARKGINPFTGEEIMIKARPARKVVKIKALKKLKEMVE